MVPYPIIPVCTEQAASEDIVAPVTIVACLDCGAILLRDVIEPSVLYQKFHNDAVGPTWSDHHDVFASLILRRFSSGRLVELGAGSGALVQRLLAHPECKIEIEVIDPQYRGPTSNVTVHRQLLSDEVAERLKAQFDVFVSSHTLEHFVEFGSYFTLARKMLKDGGFIVTSVPNQEASFICGAGNSMMWEHPTMCTNFHWMYLHHAHGFAIRHLKPFGKHSMMFVAEKQETPVHVEFGIDCISYTKAMLNDYTMAILNRKELVLRTIDDAHDNWLFGAHFNAQALFAYGVNPNLFQGILDNSALKHGKRLYGTPLMCSKPGDVIMRNRPGKPLRVFVNLGVYNKEVCSQLKALDDSIDLVEL